MQRLTGAALGALLLASCGGATPCSAGSKSGVDGTLDVSVVGTLPVTTVVTGGVAGSLGVGGLGANGAAVSGNPVYVGGRDISGNLQAFRLDAYGELYVLALGSSSPGGTPSNGATGTVVMGVDASNAARYLFTDPSGTTAVGVRPLGTAITASSANVANSPAVATLAGVAGKTTYITGFSCTASGSTGAAVVTATVAGVITGTMNYTFVFPAGAQVGAAPLIVTLPTPVPASAVNTAIVVTLPSGGPGNTNATCNATGFQL